MPCLPKKKKEKRKHPSLPASPVAAHPLNRAHDATAPDCQSGASASAATRPRERAAAHAVVTAVDAGAAHPGNALADAALRGLEAGDGRHAGSRHLAGRARRRGHRLARGCDGVW